MNLNSTRDVRSRGQGEIVQNITYQGHTINKKIIRDNWGGPSVFRRDSPGESIIHREDW